MPIQRNDKIIFDSDFPHEHPLVQVKGIDLLDLSPQDKNLILAPEEKKNNIKRHTAHRLRYKEKARSPV